MKLAHRYGIVVVASAALAFPALAGAAAKLPIPVASERAAAFAASTCERDESCAKHGVANCRRQRARVVLCRVFLVRDTEVQGRYRCSRLVRLGPVRGGRHAKVTGLGRWHC